MSKLLSEKKARLTVLLGIGLSLISLIWIIVTANAALGAFFLAGIALLIIGFWQLKKLKAYIFTLVVIFSAAAALFYPSLFTHFNGTSTKTWIVPILMVIMFGMGTSMELKDFYGVIKMPKAVLVGILCQFTIMPIVGFTLATLSGLPPEIAAGIILIGCSPSGMSSNVISYIAKANLALSLTLTMVATLLAPFLTPLLMSVLANELVPINGSAMFLSIIKIVIIPVIIGMICKYIFSKYKSFLDKTMPLASMAGIAIVIVIIVAAGRDSLLDIGLKLIFLVVIHNIIGYLLGFFLSKKAGLDEQSCRTIAIEVGMQNGGLALGIAIEMGKVLTMGLAPTVFGPFMNITGSMIGSYWAGSSVSKRIKLPKNY